MTIKHGILGTGGMGNHHADRFHEIDGVELFGCYDVNTERSAAYAQKHGVSHVMPDVDALIDGCDAISIVTPDAFHAALSLKVLDAGKHLLCEKPLTTNLPDAVKVARAAVAAAEKHGAVHMVNFSYRESAAFQEAIRLAQSGALGAIRHATGKYLQAWLSSNIWGKSISEAWLWRQQIPPGGGVAAGGTLGDIGCHILDFTTAAAGDVAALRCSTRNFPKVHPDTGETMTQYDGKALNANDSVLIELDLSAGGLGVIETTRWATGHANQVALGVYGTHGAVEIDLERSYTTLRTCLGDARHKAKWSEVHLDKTPNNYARFARSIQAGDNDQPDIVRGAQVQAYLDACERSAEDGGKRVTIKPWL